MSTSRRTAFVTGASQGLGAAIATALAQAQFDVAVSGTRAASLGDTMGRIEAAGARAVAVELDLREPSNAERAMAEVITAFGHLDVLVNNAGITLRKWALEVTPAEWEALLDINLKGAFFLSQQMGRHLVASGRTGCIVNIASTYGIVGYAQRSVYGISKAGLIHMTKMLAIEWAEHGIRVNAVAPGTVDTPSRAAYFAADTAARDAIRARVPLRRFATMEEVAAAVCYLVGPQAEYITGHTLLLDGGLTAY
ncbi:MAG: SDR family oxidoreductase [Betaproteobacteria bacterium]|nr:SDR family oxidoreductase [Betaproteobacteria bacterium]